MTPAANIWVADTGASRVMEFSPSGALLTSFGGPGAGSGQLNAPASLAIAASGGTVYVAGQGNNRIDEFSSPGRYLSSIPVGTPFGVALDARGDIWVASPSYADGNAVYEFSAAGAPLETFGVTQASYGAMSDVGGIAIGPSGRVYVAQPDYGWVSVYNPAENLAFPQALAIRNGHIWVADSGNHRITEFAPPPATARAAAVPLWQRGMQRRPAGWFENDAINDRLPQVSWLVAPTAQTEHPDYFPAAVAEYIAQKLDAIAANPDVWAKTAFILTYDENDGMFDHVPPPAAPAGTAAEFVGGEPIGLGFRVPCTLVSPWTAGGHVYSGVLDHSSLIRFIEARFGVREPNISAWRRQTCGDFTPAFRFSGRPARYPAGNQALSLATTEAGLLIAQQGVNDNPAPVIPAKNHPLPGQ